MPLIDRIDFDAPSDGRRFIRHCHTERIEASLSFGPSPQCVNFPLGGQLIINQNQEALLLNGGEVCDLFGWGAHLSRKGTILLTDPISREKHL
ncbi:MAG: hypothetical protein ABSA97_09630 [Verrucomicrobiia bacterium]|jgi:membrane protease subunit (stomatin/prohibitin family)